jgi:hypothetical protein
LQRPASIEIIFSSIGEAPRNTRRPVWCSLFV